jgi:hypothetical protein
MSVMQMLRDAFLAQRKRASAYARARHVFRALLIGWTMLAAVFSMALAQGWAGLAPVCIASSATP